ncbi:hypothetical protein ZWY2020_027813 [Hordeum vulgare]|nr:hypothetical protein ZWY2020_027813 [Hordeum vulgare]
MRTNGGRCRQRAGGAGPPWLPPPDLPSRLPPAAPCAAASAVTARRAADSACGLEAFPAPFVNPIDSQPYSYFIYTPFPHSFRGSFHAQPWAAHGPGRWGPPGPAPDLASLRGVLCAWVCGGAGACADAEAVAADPSGAGCGASASAATVRVRAPRARTGGRSAASRRLRVERQLKQVSSDNRRSPEEA